ncbi:DUF4910 domain-containing protein [Lachnospiraceae bacterium JLR.KK008]
MNGKDMYALAGRLYPINRSLTGNGVRESLRILKEYIPELQIHEVPTGTKAFDWEIPDEWEINDGYVENSGGGQKSLISKTTTYILWDTPRLLTAMFPGRSY